MSEIKFSNEYYKIPTISLKGTVLLQVLKTHFNELSEDFIIYDTSYFDVEKRTIRRYPLPKTDLLILLLKTKDKLWTTIRRWTPRKEIYYRKLMGCEVDILVKKKETSKG